MSLSREYPDLHLLTALKDAALGYVLDNLWVDGLSMILPLTNILYMDTIDTSENID